MVYSSKEAVKITGVALISVSLGVLLMITSSMVIQSKESLTNIESNLFWIWIFSVLTIIAGFLQFWCGVCLLLRRILVRRWITVNAISFLVVMLAVCIMSTTLLRTTNYSSPSIPDVAVSNVSEGESFPRNVTIIGNEIQSNGTEGLSLENFAEEDTPSTVNINDSDILEVETIPLNRGNPRPVELKFYCSTLIADFIFLPIFLGMMASRATHEYKGRTLVEKTFVYPLMTN